MIISIFTNKGGSYKTTLTANIAKEVSKTRKVLMIDADPQCSLGSLYYGEDELAKLWEEEDYVVNYENTGNINHLLEDTRSLHFILSPIEQGINDFSIIPPPKEVSDNLYLIPSRTTLHTYENKVAERLNGLATNDPLSIRTYLGIYTLIQRYLTEYDFNVVFMDMSPALGLLNRTILSTLNYIFAPYNHESSFSKLGLLNTKRALVTWKNHLDLMKLRGLNRTNVEKFPKHSPYIFGLIDISESQESISMSSKIYTQKDDHYYDLIRDINNLTEDQIQY